MRKYFDCELWHGIQLDHGQDKDPYYHQSNFIVSFKKEKSEELEIKTKSSGFCKKGEQYTIVFSNMTVYLQK